MGAEETGRWKVVAVAIASIVVQASLRELLPGVFGAMVSVIGEAAAEAMLAHRGAHRSVVTDIDIRYLAMGRVGPIHSQARLLGDAPTDAIAVELYDRGRDDRIISTMLMRATAAPSLG